MENNIYKMGPTLHNVELESFEDDPELNPKILAIILAVIYVILFIIIPLGYSKYKNYNRHNNIDKYLIKPN
jgi:hypothetical protein